MAEETEGKKKSGFFGKLMRIAFIAAIVAAVVAVFKRRRGQGPRRGRVAGAAAAGRRVDASEHEA